MTTMLGRPVSPELVPDDRRGGNARLVPLFVATAASVGLAARSVPVERNATAVSAVAGLLVAGLAIFLLQSIRARWASRVVVLLGAVIMVRYGEASGGGAFTSVRSLLWAAATVAAFVLGSRLGSASVDARAGDVGRGGRPMSALQAIAVVAALVVAATLTFGPRVSSWMSPSAASGRSADRRDRVQSNPMVAADQMDAASRPRLSERLVMTVRSPRPSFWRTGTFDRFDGQRWTRSNAGAALVAGGRVSTPADDLSARSGEPLVQRIRLEAAYSEVLPAAPSPVSVESRSLLAQWSDGTIVAADAPLGVGTTYTVTSRQIPVTDAAMAAADGQPVPNSVLRRYAARPTASSRVAQLAADVTAGVNGTRAKVDALIAWMGSNLTYSLDAPLPSRGGDVVDEFLFTTKQGWCEQIASALTVMLRELGIPARVATGFVPGEWDAVTQAYRVRERDAHAWTEVWFAGLGWVPFDPTAAVPPAGSTTSGAAAASWWWDHAVAVLLAIALVVGVASPVGRAVQRAAAAWRARRDRRGGVLGSPTWVGRIVSDLERVGRSSGRPRAPDETVARFTAALAECSGDERFVSLGEELDAVTYGSDPPADARERLEPLARELSATRTLGRASRIRD